MHNARILEVQRIVTRYNEQQQNLHFMYIIHLFSCVVFILGRIGITFLLHHNPTTFCVIIVTTDVDNNTCLNCITHT